MLALCIGILLALPLVDLGMKYYVEKHISSKEEIPICKGRILVRHVHNQGMALNFLERYPALVKWCSFLAVIPIGVYYGMLLFRKGNALEKLSFSLVLGGAISNVYDRFVRKYVVDYVGFRSKWKKISDITFNLGDFGIFAGALGIILSALLPKR